MQDTVEAKLTEFGNSFNGTMKKEKFMIEIVSLSMVTPLTSEGDLISLLRL